MSFTNVTVTGTFLHPDGTPAAGTITFTLSAELQDPASNDICSPIPVTATLDDTGSFTVVLTANDDVGIQPTGSVYNIVERIRHAPRRSYSVSLTHTTPSVQLADLAPAIDGNATYGVTSVNGKTGAVVLVANDVGGLGTAATHAATDFDVAGAATGAVSTHTGAADPHGDRGYTDTKVAALVNAAPAALDTLKELADALGDDANYAATVTAALAGKLNVVVHGATAGTARPAAAAQVLWIGTVAPTNAATNDLWWDKTATLIKLWSGTAWQASGASTYAPIGVPAWMAATAYAAGQEALDPAGNLIIRTASGTSSASYDATEQALWTSAGGAALATATGRAVAFALVLGG